MGSQTNAYMATSDIVIFVGDRGVGKTHLILTKALPKIHHPLYKVAYLRREIKDAQGTGGIADASKPIFGQFGVYLESVQNMYWRFNSGAKAVFMNYSAPTKEFMEAIQGKEYTDAIIDEITHIDEERFNAVFSNLRNTYGDRTQIFGTCNADPNSWIKNLIEWYLDPDTGLHIPERDGKERFFFQYGNTILESYWGDTKEEVYELAKPYIDAVWKPEMAMGGETKLDLILSLSVFEGKMYENERLMKSGGVKYMAKLQKGSLQMKSRYAKACWKSVNTTTGLLSESDIDRIIHNTPNRSGVRYASMDVGGEGSDKVVIWIWDGLHIENVYSTSGKKAKDLVDWTSRILNRENIPMQNFIYDAIGVGYAFSGYFEDAVKFISNAKPTEDSRVKTTDRQIVKMYADLKSQTIGEFLNIVHNYDGEGLCGISMAEHIPNMMINGMTVKNHLLLERQAIRWNGSNDGVLKSINKKEVKALIGRSPDFMLSIIYRVGLGLGRGSYKPATKKSISKIRNFFRKR